MEKEKLMTEEEWLAKYNASQKKSKKKNTKKWVRNGVALTLVAVLSIAGTLAYLQKKSGTKTNTFTGSAGLKLILTETQWDWDNDDDPDDGEPLKNASEYKPETEYKKNPQLVNTNAFSDLTTDTDHAITDVTTTNSKYDEYVAMRIDFKGATEGTSVTYNNILSVIEPIQFNTSDWELVKAYTTQWVDVTNADIADSNSNGKIEKNELGANILNAKCLIFAFKTGSGYKTLAKNTYTSALYDSIKTLASIPGTLGGTDSADKDFPTFSLIMSGAAVDTASFSSATDTKIITALFGLLDTAP